MKGNITIKVQLALNGMDYSKGTKYRTQNIIIITLHYSQGWRLMKYAEWMDVGKVHELDYKGVTGNSLNSVNNACVKEMGQINRKWEQIKWSYDTSRKTVQNTDEINLL